MNQKSYYKERGRKGGKREQRKDGANKKQDDRLKSDNTNNHIKCTQ